MASCSEPRTLDVYHLPASGLDATHPIWWGNTLALAVETTIMMLLVVTYFYVRKNFQPWPPPRVDAGPPILHPYPHLGFATANTALLLLSLIPMIAIDRTARTRARQEELS